MQTHRGRSLLTCLFVVLFAFASLAHAPGMMQAATVDCHGNASTTAPEHRHDTADPGAYAPAEQAPHHPAAMPIGCPLANLPAPPEAQALGDRREGATARYAVATLPAPPSADLAPLDPPPRRIS